MPALRHNLLFAVVFWFFSQVPAFADEPAPSPPRQPIWKVDIEPDQCTLTHPINEGGLSSLAIQSWAGEDAHNVFVMATELPSLPQDELFPALIDFQSGHPPMHQLAKISSLKGGKVLMMLGVSNEFLDALSHATAITMAKGSKMVGPITLPHATGAIDAQRKCLNDQLMAWGADPTQFQPGGQPPHALVDRDNFVPNPALLQMNIQGDTMEARFKLGIATDGTIESCQRIDANATDNVEKIACGAVMSRTLFSPAHDPNGAAVKGIATFRVMLTLQKRTALH